MNEQSLTPPDFGIYVYDPTTGQNQLVYNDRTTWELNALAVAPRTEPPVIGAREQRSGLDGRRSASVRSTSRRRASTRSSTARSSTTRRSAHALQGRGRGPRHRRLLERGGEGRDDVRSHDARRRGGPRRGARLPDGSWLANVPPYIPMHLQPIDKFGLAIRNQQLWIQGDARREPPLRRLPRVAHGPGRPGASVRTRRSRSSKGPQASPSRSPNRTEFPWDKKVTADPRCQVRAVPQRRRRPATTR